MKRYLQKIGLLLGLLMVTVTGWGAAPTVVTYDPAQGATGVAVDKVLTLTFDQNIQVGTTLKTIKIVDASTGLTFKSLSFVGGVLPSGVSINQNVFSVDLSIDFGYGKNYYVTIPSGLIKNSSGEFYTGLLANVWNFTIDNINTNPEIVAFSPLNGSNSIDVDANIVLTFNQPIKFQSGGEEDYAAISLYDISDNLISTFVTNYGVIIYELNGVCSIADKTLTINPSSSLEYGTEYYVNISYESGFGAICSSVNNLPFLGLSGNSDYTFTTVNPPVPSLSNPPLSPADNSTDVDIASNLAITFTSNIQFNSTATSHSINIYQTGNSTPIETITCVSGSATYATGSAVISGAALTINPIADLTPGASYYVTIDAGAIESTVGGIYPGFTDATTWNFSTYIQVAYIDSYPNVQNIGSTTVDAYSSLNKVGTTKCVVVKSSEATPTLLQVWNGQDASGTSVSTAHKGSIVIDEAGVIGAISLSLLSENTSYKVCFVSKDGSGNYIETDSPSVVTFSTIDTSAPTLTFDPVDGNENVPIEQVVTITFSEAIRNIDDSEITNDNVSNLIMFTVGGVEVPRTVTFDNLTRVITINTTSLLDAGMTYYLTVKSVEDFNGNPTGSNTIYFITKDTTAPYIKTSIPANGAKNVSLYEPVVITFNEPILNFDGSEVTSASISTILSISPAVSYSASISADKSIVTLTPNEYAMTTLYTVTLNGNTIKDKSGNVTTASSSFSFTTETCNIWNGSTNSDMKDANNWTGTYTAGKSIVVENGAFPMIMSDSYYLPSLIIKAGADVKIESGYTVDLTVDLRVYSSNTENIGNGSILIDGTLNVESENVYFYQNISSATPVYHISTPVAGATQTSIGCDKMSYKQVSPTYTWVTVDPNAEMIAGRGYAAKDNAADVWKFCGAINNATSYSLNCERNANNYGWNFVGNPYPCAINWDNVTLTNVNPTFYIWRSSLNVYGTYNRTGGGVSSNLTTPNACLIPSMHAFFVQVPIGETNGQLVIPAASRDFNKFSYLKSLDASANSSFTLIGRVGTSVNDEAIIRFIDGASTNVDGDDFDSPKMLSANASVLDFYVYENGKQYAISSLASEDLKSSTINLGYKHNSTITETAYIELKSFENIDETVGVWLEDKSKPEQGKIDFRLNPLYSFSVSGKVEVNDRFVLYFQKESSSPVTNIDDDLSDKSSCIVYSINNDVFVSVKAVENASCQILDVNGKLILDERLNVNSLNSFKVNSTGVFVIKVTSEKEVWNYKVLINK